MKSAGMGLSGKWHGSCLAFPIWTAT